MRVIQYLAYITKRLFEVSPFLTVAINELCHTAAGRRGKLYGLRLLNG
jgi:hypothetical protein